MHNEDVDPVTEPCCGLCGRECECCAGICERCANWIDHTDLFSEIAERREAPEFAARLDRIMTEEKHILDRLAKDD